MAGKRVTLTLTPGELAATFQALDASLAGDTQDSLSVYANGSAISAAQRAYEKVSAALNGGATNGR